MENYTGNNYAQNYEIARMQEAARQAAARQEAARLAAEKREASRRERSGIFRIFGIPALAYALVTAFFLYSDCLGIAVTLESAATVLFAVLTVKRAGLTLCRGSRICLAAILLLGLSAFLTGNGLIQFLDVIGIFFLLLFVLILNFRKPAGDDFAENAGELVKAPIRGIAGLGNPFRDTYSYIRTQKNGWKKPTLPILIGLAVALPVCVLILFLLCSADAVFNQMFSDLFRTISWAPVLILFSAIHWFIAVYAIVRRLPEARPAEKKCRSRANAVIGISACLPIALIYLVFSVIQILFLFIGNMNLPEGYSYADYVHEGFYQLMAACLLNLVIVLFVKEFFRESRFLNVILTVIGACTYIMTASSVLRTVMYIQSYGLTFLRVVVLWILAVVAVLFAGVLVRIWNGKFCLFRYMLATLVSAWLIFAFSRPEHFIARYDLYFSEAETDFQYLSYLSTDAASAIYEYAQDSGPDTGLDNKKIYDRYKMISVYGDLNSGEKNWRETNLSDLIFSNLRKD